LSVCYRKPIEATFSLWLAPRRRRLIGFLRRAWPARFAGSSPKNSGGTTTGGDGPGGLVMLARLSGTAAPTVMSFGMSAVLPPPSYLSLASSRMACRIAECTVHSHVLCHYCLVGRVQISSTPTVACSLAFPSGSAILPSTTIGLFQWPLPHSRLAICVPLRGS
jgi:hypothetical protein